MDRIRRITLHKLLAGICLALFVAVPATVSWANLRLLTPIKLAAPPSSFSLTAVSPYVEENTVTWGAATGAASYTLKRGTAPGVYGTTLSTNATSPYYDTGLTAGTTYYYRAYAVGPGGTTTSSNELTGYPPIYSSLHFVTNKYISAPTNSGLNPNYNSAYWMSFWIRTTQTGQPTLLSNLNGSGFGTYMLLDSGKIRIAMYGSGGSVDVRTTSATVNDGNLHHVVINKTTSSSASAFTFYIDNGTGLTTSSGLTSLSDTLATRTTTTTATVTIGADLLGGGGSAEGFFSGYLNQFAFKMNDTVTSGNVSTIYNSGVATEAIGTFSPTVWLFLYGGTDTIASNGLLDRGSSSMNFTPVNMTSADVTSNIRIGIGKSLVYNGTDTMLKDASGDTTLNFSKTQKLGFAMWLYVATADLGKASLFCREALLSPYKGWDDFISATGKLSWYATNTYPTNLLNISATTSLPTSQWVLTVIYTDGTGTLAGTHGWQIPRGSLSYSELTFAGTDSLSSDITNAATQYTMGNVELDTGNDFLKGKTYYAGIFEGETIDSTWIDSYLLIHGYPRDMARAQGIHNFWKNGSAPGDSVSTLKDVVGGVDMTVQGTAVIADDSPLWIN